MPYKSVAEVKTRKKVADFQNNTNISLQNGYVYFAVDKVANSSIKNALFDIEFAPVGKKAPTLYDKRSSPLLSPYQLTERMRRDVFNSGNYFRFAFVRNPFSRLLSCYLDRILTASSKPRRQLNVRLKAMDKDPDNVTFADFISVVCSQSSPQQNSHWRCQYDDILYGSIDFDFIGKFENLWPDMATVSKRIWGELRPQMNQTDVNKSPQATSAGSKLAAYYTEELESMVAERFALDFDTFGYAKQVAKTTDSAPTPPKSANRLGSKGVGQSGT